MIKRNLNKMIKRQIKWLFRLANKLPVKKNVIIFESFLGKQYSDSPKSIYLYLKEHYPHYKMYWSFERGKKADFLDEDIIAIPRFGLKWIILMARAEYWVSNSRLPLWLPKRKETVYVQTWHGTPLKRLAADMDEVHMPGTNTESYKRNFVKESSKWDYLVSPNSYSTEIFKRAFRFNKTVIESGYPRNDILVQKNNAYDINKIKEKVSIPKNKKVILYAPTWRDNEYYSKGKYKFSLQLDLEKMQDKLGDEYIILLRLHYLIALNLDLNGYKDFVFNMSDYGDINELYLISDLLITDYSSVFFDYGILNRPMLFFTYDIESYRDHLRGFYFEFESEAPGPLLSNTDQVISAIQSIEEITEKYDSKMKRFRNKYCYLEDGKATERVVKSIFPD